MSPGSEARLRVALFAADVVGLEVAKCLQLSGVAPVCVVLDDEDRSQTNEAIRSIHTDAPVLMVSELETPECYQALTDLEPDLGLLAWWPRIIRGKLLQLPRLGYLNFHPSLLPHSRGKDPNFWSIVEGTPFGVSIHFIDEGIDTGPIAFQAELPVTWEDTGETLYRRAQQEIVRLFKNNLERIMSGDIPRIPQHHVSATYHRRDELEAASTIHLDAPTTAREVLNRVRARTFSEKPAARFMDTGSTYEVRTIIRRVEDT